MRDSPGRIAMLVIGLILAFPVFALWELYCATFPLMPGRVLRRKGVLLALLIVFLFQFASAFPSRVLRDFIPVAWKLGAIGYLFSASSIAYTASAPLLGAAYYAARRFKPFLIIGSVLFVVYVQQNLMFRKAPADALGLGGVDFGCTLHANGTAQLMTFTIQVFIGLASIAIDLSTLISTQASVTHGDLAIVTALVFAWSQIAASLGTSAAIAIS
ncbi:hypothetical protein FRC11_004915, partial [Ceratobasidium sp. 423]